MAVQRYSYPSLSVGNGTWEEYWYDALGRRVLTRARRNPADTTYNAQFARKLCLGTTECRSFTERVWWDGDNALVEERTPEGTSDVSNSGVIGNINGLTIDEPLAVMADHIRIINYNWRGQGMSSVFIGGGAAGLSLGNTATEIDWPAATQASTYYAASPDASPSNTAKRWMGTFVANGQGTTGMLYRRNRYFDPKSGQFTQADPIGIAGGMNVFGFANGDPVNFSDPLGLCSNPFGKGLASLQCALEDIVGAVKASPELILDAVSKSPHKRFVIGLATLPLTFAGGFEAEGVKLTRAGVVHVLERHFPLAEKSAGKSIFNAGESIVDLAREASRIKPTIQPNGNLQRVVNAGREIGIDRTTSSPTSVYTVITNKVHELITMFPGRSPK